MQLRAVISHPASVVTALIAWVFATRLWLIGAGGSIVPFMDQWGAEALGLYRPWLDGTLQWSDLFAAHNEHRIVLTRLADLALFEVGGGWNPWHQMMLNAALHAVTAAALAAVFWTALAPRARIALVGVLAVVFASPCGWQNALWGFQSQVYFANVLTVAAVAGLVGSKPLQRGWWGGLLAASLALAANAGGLLASVAALGVILGALPLRVVRGRERVSVPVSTAVPSLPLTETVSTATEPRRGHAVVGAVIVGLVVALGLALRVDAAHHASLQAKSASQFLAVFARGLAWPHLNQPVFALLMQLPLLLVVIDHVRRRAPLGRALRTAVALGGFALLQAAAVAYSRGAGLPEERPLSRYQDPLLLGVAAQAFAAFVLAVRHGARGRIALVGWLAVLCFGLVTLTETNLTLNLSYKRAHDAASLANVRDYAATRDPAMLERTFDFPQPLEDAAVMRSVLDDPSVRHVLPAALFAPLLAEAVRPPLIIRLAPWLTVVAGMVFMLAIAVSVKATARKTD